MKLSDVTSDTICDICGRRASQPYRNIVAGQIREGCVARMHDAFLPAHTNTSAWVQSARRSFKAARQVRLSGIGGK